MRGRAQALPKENGYPLLVPEELRMAAYAGMGISAIMILFNLAKFKKRGWSVLYMATAFAAFGLLLKALIDSAPDWQIYVLAFVLCFGLVGDGISKVGKPKETPKS